MGLFTRKNEKQEVVIPPVKKEDGRDLSELNSCKNEFDIDEVIKKDFSYDQFQVQNSSQDGNYFGEEFDIQSTIGRLKGLYVKEPWVNTCSSLIARNLCTVPFKVYSKTTNEIVKDHPLNDVINSGNYITSQKFRDNCCFIDLVLAGNYFLILSEDNKNCFWVPAQDVTPKLRSIESNDDAKKIQKVGAIESITINESSILKVSKKEIPFEKVVHVKLPNPFNPFYGLPLIIAASRPILLDRYKNEYEMAFYLRGGMHSGVIETEQDISKTRMERLMRTFEQAFTGKRNWWRQLFLPKGAKWINSTLSMSEMQHLESLKENRTTLLANLGIPPSQVGIVQDVNRSTAEDQKSNLWNNTIVPLCLMIESGWNSSYLVKEVYKDKVYIKADFEGLDALEGSFYTKCELAEKAAKFMTIDEIREFILNIPKVGDERGNMFIAEMVKAVSQTSPEDKPASEEEEKPTEEPSPMSDEEKAKDILAKKKATDNQQRLENNYEKKYEEAYDSYFGLILANARYALRSGKDVGAVLAMNFENRKEVYIKNVLPIAQGLLDQSFDMSTDSTKSVTGIQTKNAVSFDENDELAILMIKQRTEEGQRKTLANRILNGFIDATGGIDAIRSEEIMKIIDEGLAQGKTGDAIANELETNYRQKYGYRTNTIVRTEILSSISQGIEWNHQVLGQVFTEVRKQWFHVGDSTSNPDARDEHADFETEGVVSSSHLWYNPTTGAKLAYPRDPKAGAKDIINCRCTMVTVIPKSATSRSDVWLNQ